MKAFDFGSIIVCNNDFTEQTLNKTFDFLADSGIRRVIFTFDYNCDTSNLPNHILKLSSLNLLVAKLKRRGVFVKVFSSVPASHNAIYDYSLSRLSIKQKTKDYIFLDLQLFADRDTLDNDLNFLIHKQMINPIFTSFERHIITGKNDFSAHILKTPGATFLFDVNQITQPKLTEEIKRCVINNIPIMLCLSNAIDNYFITSENMQYFKMRLGQTNYAAFLANIGRTSTAIFGKK